MNHMSIGLTTTPPPPHTHQYLWGVGVGVGWWWCWLVGGVYVCGFMVGGGARSGGAGGWC